MFLRCIASFIISIHMIKISTSERPRAKRGRAEFAATFQLGRHITLQHIVQRRQVGCSWKLKPALAVQHVSKLYGYSALMIFLRKERAGEESKQKISAKVDGGKNERSAKKKVEEEEEDIRVREVGKRGRDGGKCGSGRKNSALARRARRQDSSSSNPDQPQPGARQSENSRQVC